MEPVDGAVAEEFAASLPDHPLTFGPRSLLQRGLGKAWLRGPPSQPTAAVVVAPWMPTEPMAFGTDAEAISALLRELPAWECVDVASEMAPRLAGVIERDLRTTTSLLDDVYFVLDHPPIPHLHPSVRRLTEDDLETIDRAPEPLRPVGFLSTLAALSGGVVAGGIVDGSLVSSVAMTVSSERYADLAAHTLEPFRNRGMGSAAAYLVAQEVYSRGMTPVWSTGADNLRSQRVAERLGFREFGRETYVILARPASHPERGKRPP
jgi:FR47-like protein